MDSLVVRTLTWDVKASASWFLAYTGRKRNLNIPGPTLEPVTTSLLKLNTKLIDKLGKVFDSYDLFGIKRLKQSL